MLLRSKKTHGEEQNWCVILSPIRNEFDKKKVAHKISEIFSVSSEESMDLVSNTPIILLDNLTRTVASKIKEYFTGIGADMVLTNDILQKRKCYRTVWPEAPNLSFLHEWQPAESHPGAQTIPTAEALEEIRSLEPPISITAKSSNLKFSDFANPERNAEKQEVERLRKECAVLREQVDHLRQELEQTREQSRNNRAVENQAFMTEKEKETKELRMLLAHAEEKYQVLHEEYREARSLYEEKISQAAREAELARGKGQETARLLQGFQTEKQALLDTMSQKETLLNRQREDNEKIVQALEQKVSSAQQEIESMKLRAREMNEKIVFLQRNKEQLESSVNEQADKISHLTDRQRGLSENQEQLRRQKEEELTARQAAEKLLKEANLKLTELQSELESRSSEIKRWEMKSIEIEKHFLELQEAYQNQDQILQANLRQLEHREKELESARKQLRDINFQIEQRETAQRRTRLSAELAEKEGQLKKLVGEQEKMEAEIRDREEAIRKVLVEQERIEKDIMEGKQAQRHLAELAKREKGPRFKNGKETDENGAAAEIGEA